MPTEPTGQEHLTPIKIKDTSATERATFRRCRRQWFLTVVHRLQGVEGNQNFWLGTIVHLGLETYYRSMMDAGFDSRLSRGQREAMHLVAANEALDAYQRDYERSVVDLKKQLGFVWANLEQEYKDLGELGFEMVQAYLERELDDPIFDQIVQVETRVMVPIRNPNGRRVGWLSVKTDLVGYRGGTLAVADHKTASREASAAQLDLDDQLSAEVFAVWQDRGEFPEEAVYNVLMKKAPKPPKRLKDTKRGAALSKDKSQPTTYKMYVEAVEELGLRAIDYEDMLDYLWEKERAGESDFFRREVTLRTEDQMASFQRNLFEEWRDLKAVAAHPERAYPNPSPFNCSSCPVKLVCLTMQDDGDVAAIIQAGYLAGDARR